MKPQFPTKFPPLISLTCDAPLEGNTFYCIFFFYLTKCWNTWDPKGRKFNAWCWMMWWEITLSHVLSKWYGEFLNFPTYFSHPSKITSFAPNSLHDFSRDFSFDTLCQSTMVDRISANMSLKTLLFLYYYFLTFSFSFLYHWTFQLLLLFH